MLVDVKPEAADTAEQDELAQHVREFQARIQRGSNILAQAQAVPSQTTQTPQAPEELQAPPIATFGWTTIDRVATLPFIRRGPECYVAYKIYKEQYLSHIHKVFSHLTTNCAYLSKREMTQSEAHVFNEINIQHCDKNLVGEYQFKAGDGMVLLEDVKLSCQFFQACKNAMCHNKIQNDLFGYVRIAGEPAVPFVWKNGVKLVPLFYFDGKSDYLESNSLELTNGHKLGYLRFCCLVQNIREDFYKHDSVQVVDIERIKELFFPNTPFELHWPQDPNQELLAPEVRLAALHGVSGSPLPIIDTSRGYTSTTPQIQRILNNSASPASSPRHNMVLNNSIASQCATITHRQLNSDLPRQKASDYALRPSATFVPAVAYQQRNIQYSGPSYQQKCSDTSVAHQGLNLNYSEVSSGYTTANIAPIQSSAQSIPNNRSLYQQNTPPFVPTASRTSTMSVSNTTHEQINSSYFVVSHQQNIVFSGYTSSTSANSSSIQYPPSHPQRTINSCHSYQQEAPVTCVSNATHQQINPNYSIAAHQQRAAPPTSHPPRILNNSNLNQQNSDGGSNYSCEARTAGRRRSADTVKDMVAKKRKGVSCHDRQMTNNVSRISGDLPTIPSQESAITNVPHRSPQTASSPEIRLHSPLINEAALVSPHAQMQVNPASTVTAPNPYSVQGEISSALYRKLKQHLTKLVGSLDPRNFQSIIKEIAFSFMMEEKIMSLHQQQNLAVPIQRGLSKLLIEMTAEKLQATQHHSGCPPSGNQSSASSVEQNENINKLEQVVEHIDMQWPDKEPYAIRACFVRGQEISGISISPIGNEFLVNLSEVILKCWKPLDSGKLSSSNFRELFQLNPVQQVQWDRLKRSRLVHCTGAYKDIFVRYSEVIEKISK